MNAARAFWRWLTGQHLRVDPTFGDATPTMDPELSAQLRDLADELETVTTRLRETVEDAEART